MTDRPVSRKGRRARIHGREPIPQLGLTPDLDEAEAQQQEAHFGVARDQVEHDFVISHVLSALSAHSDQFVFHGGTALSRTFLDGLRLSDAGMITAEAARVFRKYGPTKSYPRSWMFPVASLGRVA